MLQKDARNREEYGRAAEVRRPAKHPARHSRRGVIAPSLRAAPYTYRGHPSNINPRPLSGATKRGPRAFGTWGDINKGEGMKKKTKHPFALL